MIMYDSKNSNHLLNEVLCDIVSGTLKVQYQSHTYQSVYSNWDQIEFINPNNDSFVGIFMINRKRDEIAIDIYDIDPYDKHKELKNVASIVDFEEGDYERIDKVLTKALIRDDKEYCKQMLESNGNLNYPCDRNDVSRKDVLCGNVHNLICHDPLDGHEKQIEISEHDSHKLHIMIQNHFIVEGEDLRILKSDKKSVDIGKVLSKIDSIGIDNVNINGIDK